MPRTTLGNSAVKPQIGVYSCGDKQKSTITSQFEFSVSSFRDPMGQKQFEGLNGTHPEVRTWISSDSRIGILINECLLLSNDLLKPKKVGEGPDKAASVWLSFAFKDKNGKWIAPAVAELIADALAEAGYVVVTHHAGLPMESQWTPSN